LPVHEIITVPDSFGIRYSHENDSNIYFYDSSDTIVHTLEYEQITPCHYFRIVGLYMYCVKEQEGLLNVIDIYDLENNWAEKPTPFYTIAAGSFSPEPPGEFSPRTV
jgi:hypothetical protein